MGRQTSTVTNGVTTTSTFNAYGKPLTQSMPHTTGAWYYTTTEYDSMGRAISVTAPDGSATTYNYNGLTTSVTDANDHSTTTVTNILGQTLSVTPPAGPGVAFTYDPLGNLLTATRGGASTALTYDKAGRKTSISDADMGDWDYSYDALGNLTSQTDARNCTTTLTYDVLNRVSGKSYSNCPATTAVTYTYDVGTYGKGRRTSMGISGADYTSWTYDERGRVVTEAKQITGGGQFVTSFTYNSADLPVMMTYPVDNEVVTFDYNNDMQLTSVDGDSIYVSSIAYDSAGRMISRVLGNNKITSTFTYYAWNAANGAGRLQSAVHTNSTTTLQNFAYSYDSIGNILGISDSLTGENQNFGYDALDRLTSASAANGLGDYSESYAYHAATGNLQTKGDLTLQYLDSNHKHAVTNAGGNTYQYDQNGNQTTRIIGSDTYALSYDAENRLIEVRKNSAVIAQFTFDGDGKRIKSVIGSETIYFVGGHYEKQGSNATKYYFAGSQRVAMRKNGTLSFIVSDHLGSTSITTNANGIKASETRYKAFGEVRYTDGVVPTKYSYTGQYSNVADFGLLFYNARWVDPYLNRFTQPDSIVPLASQGTQAWDRYAYANNNPVRNVDPSGHGACDDYDEQGNCITDPLGRLLDYVYDEILNNKGFVKKKFTSALGVMNMIITKAAHIYGNDWQGFLCATSYVFLGVYDSSPFTMLLAHNAGSSDGFRGIQFESGAGDEGFHPDFQDDDNQVRHFWAAFATAISGGKGIYEAYMGNFYHDVVEDWMGHADTTVSDYTLSMVAIEIAAEVGSGAVASPSDLPSVFEAFLGVNSPGWTGSDLEWLFTTPDW